MIIYNVKENLEGGEVEGREGKGDNSVPVLLLTASSISAIFVLQEIIFFFVASTLDRFRGFFVCLFVSLSLDKTNVV